MAGAVVAPLARVGRAEQGDGRDAEGDRRVHHRRVVAHEQAQARNDGQRAAQVERAREVDRPRPRLRRAAVEHGLGRPPVSSGPPTTTMRACGSSATRASATAANRSGGQRLPGMLAPGWMPIRRRPRHVLAERRPQARGHGLPLGVADPQFQGGVDRRVGRDGAQDIEVAGDLAFFPVVVHAAVEQRAAPLGLEAGADARPGEPGRQGGVEGAVEGQAEIEAAPAQTADQPQVGRSPLSRRVRVELDDLVQVRVVLQQQRGRSCPSAGRCGRAATGRGRRGRWGWRAGCRR